MTKGESGEEDCVVNIHWLLQLCEMRIPWVQDNVCVPAFHHQSRFSDWKRRLELDCNYIVLLYLSRQSDLQFLLLRTHSHTFTHTLMVEELPCKLPLACSSGATRGSVSCSKTLWHMHRRSQGLNRQPYDQWTTHSTSWTTAYYCMFPELLKYME